MVPILDQPTPAPAQTADDSACFVATAAEVVRAGRHANSTDPPSQSATSNHRYRSNSHRLPPFAQRRIQHPLWWGVEPLLLSLLRDRIASHSIKDALGLGICMPVAATQAQHGVVTSNRWGKPSSPLRALPKKVPPPIVRGGGRGWNAGAPIDTTLWPSPPPLFHLPPHPTAERRSARSSCAPGTTGLPLATPLGPRVRNQRCTTARLCPAGWHRVSQKGESKWRWCSATPSVRFYRRYDWWTTSRHRWNAGIRGAEHWLNRGCHAAPPTSAVELPAHSWVNGLGASSWGTTAPRNEPK